MSLPPIQICSHRRLADDEPRVGEALKQCHYMGDGGKRWLETYLHPRRIEDL